MVWSQQQLRYSTRLGGILQEWLELSNNIISLRELHTGLIDDLSLILDSRESFITEDLCISVACIQNSMNTVVNKVAKYKKSLGEIFKRTRFLLAEMDRIGIGCDS